MGKTYCHSSRNKKKKFNNINDQLIELKCMTI